MTAKQDRILEKGVRDLMIEIITKGRKVTDIAGIPLRDAKTGEYIYTTPSAADIAQAQNYLKAKAKAKGKETDADRVNVHARNMKAARTKLRLAGSSGRVERPTAADGFPEPLEKHA